jgi:hypothetical protein
VVDLAMQTCISRSAQRFGRKLLNWTAGRAEETGVHEIEDRVEKGETRRNRAIDPRRLFYRVIGAWRLGPGRPQVHGRDL